MELILHGNYLFPIAHVYGAQNPLCIPHQHNVGFLQWFNELCSELFHLMDLLSANWWWQSSCISGNNVIHSVNQCEAYIKANCVKSVPLEIKANVSASNLNQYVKYYHLPRLMNLFLFTVSFLLSFKRRNKNNFKKGGWRRVLCHFFTDVSTCYG